MSLVGPDGQEISSKTNPTTYEVGGIRVDAADTPEMMLQKALAGAQQIVAQQVGQMAMQRSGSQVVAQTEAQAAAGKVVNPFQLEPAALAIFMLMSREIEHRDRVIFELAKRLDALDGNSSEELLKKPWPKEVEQSQESDDADPDEEPDKTESE